MSKNRDIDVIYSVLVDNNSDEIINFIRENCELLINIFSLFLETFKTIPGKPLIYEDDYSSYETIDICKKFLKYFNYEYANRFEECINNGTINLFDANDEKNMSKFPLDAHYTYIKNEYNNYHHIVNVPLEYKLSDPYLLIHEFIHYTNSNGENKNDNVKLLLSESISILFEFLLYDYLKEFNVNQNENINPILKRIDNYIYDCEELIYYLNEILEINTNLDEEYNYISDDKIKNKLLKDLVETLIYSLGTLISVLKYYDYMNNKISINSIIEYNESLKINDNLNSLNHIFIRFPTDDEIKNSVKFLRDDLLGLNTKGQKNKYIMKIERKNGGKEKR